MRSGCLLPGAFLLVALSCGIATGETLRLHSDGGDDPRAYPQECELESLGLYRLSFEARTLPGARGSCLCAGVEGVNVDLTIDARWRPYQVVFAAPFGSAGKLRLKVAFRLWNFFGDAEVRAIRIEPAEALDAIVGKQPFGTSDSLVGNVYRYATSWTGEGHNRDRALVSRRKVFFNTNRTELHKDSELVYRHEFAGRRFLSAEVRIASYNRKSGDWSVEASRDGASWQSAEATARPEAGIVAKLPAALFPAERIFVRIGRAAERSVQISGYGFTAQVDGPPDFLQGRTRYVSASEARTRPVVRVPDLHRADFGELLPVSSADIALWRAPAGRHVGLTRPVPQRRAAALEVGAAANETEAVQLVLSPRVPLKGISVVLAGDLRGPEGASIPAAAVTIPAVGYVPVTIPTDETTLPGLYPDPLLPQTGPRTLAAGTNYPYWVRIAVPKGTRPGVYRGEIAVTGSVSLRIPLAVRVYGFELPDVMTCRTLFGKTCGKYGHSALYHGVKEDADVRRVDESYFAAMSASHLSPYEGPGTWRVTWRGDEPVFDWRDFDARAEKAFGSCYRFNAFALTGDALRVGDVKPDDPRHEVRLANLLKGIEDHFAEKGLLDKAIVYCFDEPSPKSDPKIVRTFAMFEKHAPRLRRILTTPCRESLAGAPDIWCSVASDFGNAAAELRRAAGDEFWLYVCSQPLAPYATTFSDHPAVELRIWLWQSWQRGVKGVLIWSVDYWNPRGIADAPGSVLNPYANAMTWRAGGGTYGNGDGRFFYPPRSVFAEPEVFASPLRPGPNFDPPVPTVRAEMLRDGIEDYEYFEMLRRHDPKSPLLRVPDEVSRSFTEFSDDPAHLLAHRERLARAIEGTTGAQREPGPVESWDWRLPFVVSNETDVVFSALGELRAPEALRAARNVRWQVVVGGRAAGSCRYGDHLLFPCRVPAHGVVSGFVYVREGSEPEDPAAESGRRARFLASPLNCVKDPHVGDSSAWARFGEESPTSWHGRSQSVRLKGGRRYFVGGFVAGTNLANRAAIYLHVRNTQGRTRDVLTCRSPERTFPPTPVFGFVLTRTNEVAASVQASVLGVGSVVPSDVLVAECAVATPGALEVAPPAADAPLLSATQVSTLRKVFPETPVRAAGRPFALSLARGETEELQIALRAARPLERLEIRMTDLTGPGGAKLPVDVGHVRFVPIWRDEPDRQPCDTPDTDGWFGWWPDPIVAESSFATDPRRTEAVRLSVTTSSATPAGTYRGTFSCRASGKEIRHDEVEVTVWDFTIPETPEISAVFDLRAKSADERRALMTLMRRKKVCPDHLCQDLPVSRGEDGRVRIDFSEYDRAAAEYFDKFGFTASYSPQCFYGLGWGFPPGKFLGEEPYEGTSPYATADWSALRPAYKSAYQEALRLYWNHMKEKGWADRIVLYLSDEPHMFGPSSRVARVSAKIVAMCRMIREVDPKIPVYASTWNHATAWDGELNHWGIASYGAFPPEEIRRRTAAGDRIWFTTDGQMCINTPLTATERLYGNFCFDWQADGFEFWGINWYTYDPWEKGWHRAVLQNQHAGEKDHWSRFPCGDGYLVYPPRAGVSADWCSSIRLEAIRDGVEDYSYMTALSRCAAAGGVRGERAAALMEKHKSFCVIPNAGGLYSSKVMPDPERFERFRREVGAFLSGQ